MLDATETELKLALCDSATGRLRESDFWHGLRHEGTASNRSIYFDTPDQRLGRHGFTLRQRRVGNRFEQTLKMDLKVNGNGGLSRREWTWPMEQDGGPLQHLEGVEELAAVEGLELSALQPLCEVAYERCKRVWQNNGVAVELALDIGEIRANGHKEAISELELELLSGQPIDLFALARTINSVAPVHPFFTGKGSRGLALLRGPADEWSKPTPSQLDPKSSLDETLARLIGDGLDHLLANLACARAGSHPEGVHQVRVAMRRLRTLLKLLAPVLPRARTDALERQLATMAAELGPARDLDVFRGLLRDAADRAIGDAAAASQLDSLAAAMQGEAQAAARIALTSEAFGALTIELTDWQSLRCWREQPVTAASATLFQPTATVIGDRLDALHRKLRKRGRHFAELEPEERHRLRLAVKRMRYAVDLFGSLFEKKPARQYRRALVQLQDCLGNDNDVVAAAAIVERMQARRPSAPAVQAAGALLGWLRHEAQARGDAVARDWQDFVAQRPPWR